MKKVKSIRIATIDPFLDVDLDRDRILESALAYEALAHINDGRPSVRRHHHESAEAYWDALGGAR